MVEPVHKNQTGPYVEFIKPLPLYGDVPSAKYTSPDTSYTLDDALAFLTKSRQAQLTAKRRSEDPKLKARRLMNAVALGADVIPITRAQYSDPFAEAHDGLDLAQLSEDEKVDIGFLIAFENRKRMTSADYVNLAQEMGVELGVEVKENMPDLSGIVPPEMHMSSEGFDTKQFFAALVMSANKSFAQSYDFLIERTRGEARPERYKVASGNASTTVVMKINEESGLKVIVDMAFRPVDETSQTSFENLEGSAQFLAEIIYSVSKIDGFEGCGNIGAGEVMTAALSRLPGMTCDDDHQIYDVHLELDNERLEVTFTRPGAEGEQTEREYLEPAYAFVLERRNEAGDKRTFGYYPGDEGVRECDLPTLDEMWAGPDGEIDTPDVPGWQHYVELDGSRGLGKDYDGELNFELAEPEPAMAYRGEWTVLEPVDR